jgi:hypothetical protein
MLFGVAGFLQTADLDVYKKSTREYVGQLWDRWWPHRDDMQRLILPEKVWHFSRYPTSLTPDTTATFGPAGPNTSDLLFNELRACIATDASCTGAAVLNTRQIVFISPPYVKNPAQPKSGIGIPGTGAPAPVGQFWDPWGTPYNVRIDGDYDNSTTNPYGASGGAGGDPIGQGVVAWSYATDQQPGTRGDNI